MGSSVATCCVSEDEGGLRLDRWFRRHYPSLPSSCLNRCIRRGEIRVEGKRVESSTRLEVGQTIRVPPLNLAPPDPSPVRNPQEQTYLRSLILFEDRDLLVLNKPWGLASQGGSGQTRHVDGLLASLADAKGERPVLVHRLDRDTSGLLLCAKSRKIAADLGEILRAREAKKIYWALVEGCPRFEKGRISLFLAKGTGMEHARGESPDRERMRVVKHGDPEGQHSLTLYATIDAVRPRLTWLSLRPITGRTHQLRAHCEAIGHPILGDPKYNHRPAKDPARNDPLRAVPPGIEPKLHLMARRLVLPHPRGGMLDVTAPVPPHMQASFDMFGFVPPAYDPIDDTKDA